MQKEIWKEIEGYNGIYLVSNIGNVKSIDRKSKHATSGYITVFGRNKALRNWGGYPRVYLTKENTGNTFSVHRLVAKTFIPNPENKAQVNHINGIKHDNRVENLEWCTPKENMQHALSTGLKGRGETFTNSKLTDAKVLAIKRLLRLKPNVNKCKLAEKVGISNGVIYQIIREISWNHIKLK